MLNIRWSFLQETLAAFLEPGVVHLNRRLTGFEQNKDKVEIVFDNGEKVYG